MKEESVKIRFKKDPVLLDKVLQDLQQSLMRKLEWLDYAFGRAYKLVEHRPDGNKFIYPAAYNGNSEYISLLPNDNYGNFSWFDIYDPQTVISKIQGLPQIEFSGALIIWYDQRDIDADDEFVCTEEAKLEVLTVLSTPGNLKNGKLKVNSVYENFESIYRGYSIEKVYNNYNYSGEDIQSIDKQYFMYPYAGLRVEFTLTTRELCYRQYI